MHIYVSNGGSTQSARIQVPVNSNADYLFNLLNGRDYFITCKARAVGPWTRLICGATYRCYIRVRGGKGGFGSLLRAFGKQILISSNKDACRDLNGRRIRDVNNEKKLKEWLLKQTERNNEQANKSSSRKQSEHKHVFCEKLYMRQKAFIEDQVDKAVDAGFELCLASTGSSFKTNHPTNNNSGRKRADNLLLGDLSASSDDDDSDEDEIIRIDQELFDKIIAENQSIEQYLVNEQSERL